MQSLPIIIAIDVLGAVLLFAILPRLGFENDTVEVVIADSLIQLIFQF